MTVYDFSGHPPAHYPPGTDGVMRYIAPRNPDGTRRSKCVTEIELAMHKAASRPVGFVFEDNTTNCLGGAAQGNVDGSKAAAEMQTLGAPAGVACFAAVDRGVTAGELPGVAAYLDSFHRHLTALGYRRGVYGDYTVVTTMLRDGHADLAWQTSAWSGGKRATDPRVVLFQHGQVVVDGTACDVNDVLAPDWGQWDFDKENDMTDAQAAQLNETHMLVTEIDTRVGAFDARLGDLEALMKRIAAKVGA